MHPCVQQLTDASQEIWRYEIAKTPHLVGLYTSCNDNTSEC